MNPQTIQRVDRILGRPLCALLTLGRRISQCFQSDQTSLPAPRKILFLKMTEQGASVLACGAIARATAVVGRENIYFWVFEENRPILDILDVVPPENILVIRAKKPLTFLIDILTTILRIRKLGIDAVVDMEFLARASAIFAFLTGAQRRVGLHTYTLEGPKRGDLLTHRLLFNPYLHTSRHYELLVETLLTEPVSATEPMLKQPTSLVSTFPAPVFRPTDQEIDEMRTKLSRFTDVIDGPIVLLNPNASDLLPLRRWPTERFVELGKLLLQSQPHLRIVITGAPSESEAAREVALDISTAAGLPENARVISLAGDTTLRGLLVLFTLSDVLVTNDSGPGHFSTLTPIDVVAMFGPETPATFAPLGPRVHLLWSGLACSPCVSALNNRTSSCTNNVCMQSIQVEQVFQKVNELLPTRKLHRRG